MGNFRPALSGEFHTGADSPGGVFINGDHLTFDHDPSRIASAVNRIREKAAGEPRGPSVETWTEWWAPIEADPALAELVTERRSRWGGHPDYHSPGETTFMSAALQRAGFSEVGTVWQWLDNRVLVAILGDGRPARMPYVLVRRIHYR